MTKTLKRVIALLSVSMFMALFSLSCFAQENSSAKKIYTEDLGDGITAVVTLSETNGMARSSKTYNVTKESLFLICQYLYQNCILIRP